MGRKQVVRTARLTWFVDGLEELYDGPGPNRVAAQATVAVLRREKRVAPLDEAMLTGFELLAEAVDADPTNAALWSQYRAADAQLRSLKAAAVKGSKVDELKARREARHSGAADPASATRRSQPRRRAGGNRTS